MQVHNLLKVITGWPSGAASIKTRELPTQKADELNTQSLCLIFVSWLLILEETKLSLS